MSIEDIPGQPPEETIYAPDEEKEEKNQIDEIIGDLEKMGANAPALWLKYLEPEKKRDLIADMSSAGYDITVLKKLTDQEVHQVYLLFKKWNGVQSRDEQRKIMKEIGSIIE